MLARIYPSALPGLRTAGIFFLIIDLLVGAYFFRNRHQFFGKDPDVHDDPKAVRNLREEVILILGFLAMVPLLSSSSCGVLD